MLDTDKDPGSTRWGRGNSTTLRIGGTDPSITSPPNWGFGRRPFINMLPGWRTSAGGFGMALDVDVWFRRIVQPFPRGLASIPFPWRFAFSALSLPDDPNLARVFAEWDNGLETNAFFAMDSFHET